MGKGATARLFVSSDGLRLVATESESYDSSPISAAISVTRLSNLLQFGQLFKACGNNYFAQIDHIFRENL